MKRKLKITLSLLFALLFALQGLAVAFAADPETPVDDPVIKGYLYYSPGGG